LTVVGQRVAWGNRESSRPLKTRVDFQLYRDYLIVVQGSVGGVKGLRFLLDTGSTTTVLGPQLARKLNLDTTPVGVAVVSGSVKGESATAPSVQFGPIRSANVPVVIEDLSFLRGVLPFQIDAILGLDILGQSTFVIDYSSREIRFGIAPSMPNSVQLQLVNGLAFVDAEVNHTPARLLVDTAAQSLFIFDQLPVTALGATADGSQQPVGKIGQFDHNRVRQISIRLGEVNFGHESAFVVPNFRDAGHDFDGLMSPVALGFTRVAVDLIHKTMTFAR